ncbi:MAG: prepilin-type N-terminal cleavage/methylation domain-containing protein [Candidatus Nealsonbacteria bacterium]|nr:prepilin-type N-terminal cleavage/methylation domain-containing protein [Candidatus Nealsonbacteria bacterium]
MKRRRGFSLIELVVVISVGSVLLGVTVGVFHLLFRMEHTARQYVHQSAVTAQLADRFRRDVHQAVDATVADDDAGQLTLSPGHTIVYQPRPGELVRVERIDGADRCRETFSLPPQTTVSMEIADVAGSRLVRLRLVSQGSSGSAPGRELCIEALLASDHRYARTAVPTTEQDAR